MKGFKDSSGKFHPISSKGVRSRRDTSQKTQGIKYDGLGRRLPVKLGKIGDIVKVSQGSGIDSGKVGKIIGRKPAQEFPQSATDWYQVRIIKPEIMKGVIIQSPRDRLEKTSLVRKSRIETGSNVPVKIDKSAGAETAEIISDSGEYGVLTQEFNDVFYVEVYDKDGKSLYRKPLPKKKKGTGMLNY